VPHLKGEEGSTLVEYPLIFILCMTMLFGIAGFGQALYAYHFVGYAAREATRWASVHGSACTTDSSCAAAAKASDVQTYVGNMVPPGINSSQLTVTTTWPSTAGICATTSNAPGCTVQVQVSCNYSFILPLVRSSPIKLSSTSDMTITH
jgi:Flp pilus assembly protein TadG